MMSAADAAASTKIMAGSATAAATTSRRQQHAHYQRHHWRGFGVRSRIRMPASPFNKWTAVQKENYLLHWCASSGVYRSFSLALAVPQRSNNCSWNCKYNCNYNCNCNRNFICSSSSCICIPIRSRFGVSTKCQLSGFCHGLICRLPSAQHPVYRTLRLASSSYSASLRLALHLPLLHPLLPSSCAPTANPT